jgi:cytochrome P450/NADPH-cytochrome P450 reductase
LFIASFIQRFDLQLDNPASYALRLKFALTIKPVCEIRVTPRKSKFVPVPTSSTALLPNGPSENTGSVVVGKHNGKKPIYVLYGSNTGTCESLAQKIATGASAYGMSLMH